MDVYVESGVGGHIDDAVQAWVFDLPWWGTCGQGVDENDALDDLRDAIGSSGDLNVVERVDGDEQAFERDRESATASERRRTTEILRRVRAETMTLLERCTAAQLEWVDPDRDLPTWATWVTLHDMGWHVADTESRYYLSRVGIAPPLRRRHLLDELRSSAAHVHRTLGELPDNRVVEKDGEVWTTTKVLRRLAWHERGELVVMSELADKAARATSPEFPTR